MAIGGRLSSVEELEAIRAGRVPGKTLVASQRAMTGEQLAAWKHLVECARQFVRCADEFPSAPDASAEYHEALEDAQAREAAAWDGSESARVDLLYPELRLSPARPAWVPWPTSTGFWWGRARPGAPVCVVEARVDSESSWIYFTGVECPLYENEPREPWEFTPVAPPPVP